LFHVYTNCISTGGVFVLLFHSLSIKYQLIDALIYFLLAHFLLAFSCLNQYFSVQVFKNHLLKKPLSSKTASSFNKALNNKKAFSQFFSLSISTLNQRKSFT
jgi:hypothetical protein